MPGWVAQLIAMSGLLVAGTQSAIAYVESLPPRPEQAAITCHDVAWEAENLAAVPGGKVHKKLAPFVERMLGDSHSQGVALDITVGYRSCAYQLNLRKLNCGLGDYNLYQKPSNDCTPPTEPAGSSLHNEGLAIDFNCRGYALMENSPCFRWLQANAAQYHLFKHSIEAWHWSTTGK